jgi:hypothetical protein
MLLLRVQPRVAETVYVPSEANEVLNAAGSLLLVEYPLGPDQVTLGAEAKPAKVELRFKASPEQMLVELAEADIESTVTVILDV